MKNSFFVYCVLLLIGSQITSAKEVFRVSALEGIAKVQRDQKKEWDNLALEDKLADNDIVESFFQTRITLEYGINNTIILGSNTRVLLNIREEKGNGDTVIVVVNITIFAGGVLVKSVSNSKVNIYSAYAVAMIDSGTISTIVEAKTGHTGFQILGGSADVRNIAQQKWKKLALGMTTIILPGREPTAPLYITYRHVAVLKHFFGENFIDAEIDEAGIKPTEDVGATNRLSLSQNLEKERMASDNQMYKKLFNIDKIYGEILEDKEKKRKIYEPIEKPLRPFKNKGEVDFTSTIGLAGGSAYPMFSLRPSFHWQKFALGLDLPLAKNATGGMSINLNSAAGFFDKIDYIVLGSIEKERYFALKSIENYTLGSGLIVDKFKNRNLYTVTQPLGIVGKYITEIFNCDLFIADVTKFTVGGVYSSLTFANGWMGTGYYYDGNQYLSDLTGKTSRFIDMDTIGKAKRVFPDKDSAKSNTHVLELDAGFAHYATEDFSISLSIDAAWKFGTGGYAFRGPAFGMTLENIDAGISYIAEKGKLLSGHLGSLYMSNRLRIDHFNGKDTVIYQTQNNLLSRDRRSYGFLLFFRMKPVRGASIDVTFQQDFLTRDPFMVLDGSQYVRDSVNTNNNFSYSASFSINEKLVSFIKYAKAYVNQTHGGYYPKVGNYFTSWDFNAGIDVLTAPLFLNIALEAGYIFQYIDLYNSNHEFGVLNNNIDQGDNISQFYIGVRWGYLR